MHIAHVKSKGFRQETRRRFGAISCLVALVALLSVPILHTWEVGSLGADAAMAFRFLPRHAASAVSSARSPRSTHDPLACPVCQFVSRARNVLASAHPVDIHFPANVTLVWLATGKHARLDLTAAAPRAPPSYA
jgi:hypothetical protein